MTKNEKKRAFDVALAEYDVTAGPAEAEFKVSLAKAGVEYRRAVDEAEIKRMNTIKPAYATWLSATKNIHTA